MTNAGLYEGWVMHRRLRPKMHQLRYRIFSVLVDLDDLHSLGRRLRLFSFDRFNLLSLRSRDYGNGSGTCLSEQARDHLARIGVRDVGAIRLLTMPRLLGFAFNPLSLYFCHDRSEELRAILYEVHNTFGERHIYALPVTRGRAVRQSAAKEFHVSPFLPMELQYAFRVSRPGEDLNIAITVSDRKGPVLIAVQSMRRRPLTDGAILRSVALYPLMTLKVVAAILWEAGKLWWRGVPVHRHPRSGKQTARLGNPSGPTERPSENAA
ncbi:MAG TPA: DUF1365 domain-containing protein [Sphingomicrobium sp.]|nr:DUF1365 domain-containing protein [Sphingomicrobium sp.]